MKLKRARLGEKFVFPEAGGVWEKMAGDKAKMVFGKRDDVGMVVGTDPESYVYVIFEGKGQKSEVPVKQAPVKDAPVKEVPARDISTEAAPVLELPKGNGMTVLLMKDETVVVSFNDVPLDMAAAIAAVDFLKAGDKVYTVTDSGIDMKNLQMHLEVLEGDAE